MEPVDTIINISLTKDKLAANINIKPPKDGGKEPDLETIKSTLESNNVVFGVSEELLKSISNNPIYNKDIVIARGSKPIAGEDGQYELQFEANKDLKPKEKDDGSVDFHNLEIVENVKKDQLLCIIIKPTEGRDGRDVTGETISAIKGKSIPNLLGKNTKYNEDETAILSNIDGQVDFLAGKINVNEVYTIHGSVSNSTGNINALGSVVINGTVQPGFTVEAKENIEVAGNVSLATLKAGGDIILRSGAISSKLYCEGDLTTKFIENSDVFAKGEVQTAYIRLKSPSYFL